MALSSDAQLSSLLDQAYESVLSYDYIGAFRLLGGPPLSAIYREAKSEIDALMQCVREHPLFPLCQEDPYTARAFRKPRGYAGDAVMMDYMYSGRLPAGVSEVGAGVFRGTTRSSNALSVLYRRNLLAAYINDTAINMEDGRILSVAAGHCRELEDSFICSHEWRGEFVALEQDAESCAEIRRTYPSQRVTVVQAGIEQLLTRKLDPEKFDFIYCAGLYDYLPSALARHLTQRLAGMLNRGGRLLIGNFTHETAGAGYMSLFMDWHLIYRSEQELRALLPPDHAASATVTFDPHGNVFYALLKARG